MQRASKFARRWRRRALTNEPVLVAGLAYIFILLAAWGASRIWFNEKKRFIDSIKPKED
jgi:hypothetical protein